jgi:predicted permease
MVCTSITNATLGVYFAAGGSSERLGALASVFKVPLIYAVVGSFMVIWSGCEIPEMLLRAAELIGKPALPVGLLILGIQFSRMKISRELEFAGLAIGAKLILAPVLAFVILGALNVTGLERKVLLVQASMPTAIGSLTLSLRFSAKPELVSAAILGSTLLSIITITLLMRILI